ncbi:MAG: MBL fold metallo-hydrolase [Opitutaceae bacterium]|nr:MBL fold metallo-hydrolase [Opitutaceae bacterium]
MAIIGLSLAGVFIIAAFAYMQHPKFGRLPRGERLARIQKSPHYKDGRFQNAAPTPIRTGETGPFALFEFFFGDKSRRTPPAPVPSVKSDLINLDAGRDALVWFGHSSYFIQIGGKRMLVDPVFSGAASPVPFTTRAFAGADIYKADDMPGIDYLFITHDHWDHLDYETVRKLKPRVGKIICGLGTGEHLEYWGFERDRIIELDWGGECALDDGITVGCFTTRHFSGRAFSRDRSLWAAFLVRARDYKIYIGGDGGYGAHFAETGEKAGGIDLAILENGQYDKNWKHIHMMPEEVLRAAGDLGARRLLPVHSAKFSISNHAWDEPLRRLAAAHQAANAKTALLTPRIGEVVDLRGEARGFPRWWEGVGPKAP